MGPSIFARFSESLVAETAARYGLKREELSLLGGFDSRLYEFDRPDGSFILRVLQDPRRPLALVRGELDWIEHLARNGVPVARPIPSARGNLVETIPDGQGGDFLCVAFERAPGGEIRKAHIGDPFFRSYGDLLGRMHAATKTYAPGNPAWRRPDWDAAGAISADIEMPPGQDEVMGIYRKLKDRLGALPRGPESYGLIHTDVHMGNLTIAEDFSLSIFDFAECCYGHFIYDIAMVVFYSTDASDDHSEFVGRFMPPFLEAYREHNRIDPAWLAELPSFLMLREIDLYAEFLSYRATGGNNEWRDKFLDGRKEKILAGRPYIDFDWPILAKHL